jgi:hypothetical protein
MNEDIRLFKTQFSSMNKKIEIETARVNLAKGQLSEVNKQLHNEITAKEQAVADKALFEEAALTCGVFLDKSQVHIEDMFSNIGTAALTKVFGENLKLQFSFDKGKKKNPSINISVVQPYIDGEEIETDIVDGEGGAMEDLVAVSLRISMLHLYTPLQEGPLFLDESSRYMAKDETVRSLGEFLKEISEKTGRQIILISHDAEIFQYADKVFTFEAGPNKGVIVKELEAHEET